MWKRACPTAWSSSTTRAANPPGGGFSAPSDPGAADPRPSGLDVVVDLELGDRRLGAAAGGIHAGDLLNRGEEPLFAEAVICVPRLPHIDDRPLAVDIAGPVEDQPVGRVVHDVHLLLDAVVHLSADALGEVRRPYRYCHPSLLRW